MYIYNWSYTIHDTQSAQIYKHGALEPHFPSRPKEKWVNQTFIERPSFSLISVRVSTFMISRQMGAWWTINQLHQLFKYKHFLLKRFSFNHSHLTLRTSGDVLFLESFNFNILF